MSRVSMSITTLPAELLTNICVHLDLTDWCAVRLTCKTLFTGSLAAFANQYYKCISVLVTSNGLHRLEEIATHDILRAQVREIWIVPVLFEGFDKIRYQHFPSSYFGRGPRKIWAGTEADLEARYAEYQTMMTDHRSIIESSILSDTLERCVARFNNLVHIGLRSYSMHFLLNSAKETYFKCLGLRELKRQLLCHGKYNVHFCGHFDGPSPIMLGKSHALAFSALVNAMIQSSRKIRTLHTCGHYYCGLRPNNLQLTQAQYRALIPLLADLKSLHMCIRLSHKTGPNDPNFQALLDILFVVAPTLQDLTLSQWITDRELGPQYFGNISQRIHFSRLQELRLQSIEVTVDTLKIFLRTAAPTLKRLTLASVSLSDKLGSATDEDLMNSLNSLRTQFPAGIDAEIRQFWRSIFKFFRDELALHFLALEALGYRGIPLAVTDGLEREGGRPESLPAWTRRFAYFDAGRACVRFDVWVEQLKLEMSRFCILELPGPGTSKRFTPC